MKTIILVLKPGYYKNSYLETIEEAGDNDQFCEIEIKTDELPRLGDLLRFPSESILPDVHIYSYPEKQKKRKILKGHIVGDCIWMQVFEIERSIKDGILDSNIFVHCFVSPPNLQYLFEATYPEYFLLHQDGYFIMYEKKAIVSGKEVKIDPDYGTTDEGESFCVYPKKGKYFRVNKNEIELTETKSTF